MFENSASSVVTMTTPIPWGSKLLPSRYGARQNSARLRS